MSLLDYEQSFSNLRLNTYEEGQKSPHKVAMLLAVIELIEQSSMIQNRIFFDKPLIDSFNRHFEKIASPSDRNNPHLPFFHLRSSGFWHHYPKPGKAKEYESLNKVGSAGMLNEYIAYAYLDDELFELLGNGVVRELLRSSLHSNLTTRKRDALLNTRPGWNWLECETIVADYLAMLNKELRGEGYSKAAHRRALKPKLDNRSEGSIEYKHQNISAILIEMGQPYIAGYKPAFNYQQQLKQVVFAHLAANSLHIESIAQAADKTDFDIPSQVDWSYVYDPDVPEHIPQAGEPPREYLAKKINFTEREARNRRLGERGEEFVIQFEHYRLCQANREDLAREIEWSSQKYGDGLGYDIRSFDPLHEEELFIEVKTTSSGKYQPFYISENELEFSRSNSEAYRLYRVYDFRKQTRLFQLAGAVDQHATLSPQVYKASFHTKSI